MPSQEELEKQGWAPASVTGGEHLRRVLEMYQELGFETHLEEINPEECSECTECYKSGGETIYRVYTRPRDSQLGGLVGQGGEEGREIIGEQAEKSEKPIG